ncbi:MOSC domain-containing protein [Flagellimonas hymeniacidonis]|uniref:MOSC domain-containing protein n=1 Tax=Flagellimonas hymeniacidonis TaxID=2603628 RepID=A0A5C8UZL2_9FLAO|nr:MOSC domain-containing protein [Flagellimonas hymeniacidonis]TXN34262.1 MOSC domain-containing protein [Flagellimonas hymeniacidonis]
MQIISTNIGNPTPIQWNGQQTTTGIFKFPVNEPLLLEEEAVAKDTVSDRKVHGGVFKACYLFSADHYPYWKERYPALEWNWGMFGENLTVEGLDEAKIRIGNIYKVGSALVQVTQPREPCFKLGIKFGTQEILREFIDHSFPGTYVRILEVGEVNTGDTLELVEESENALTVQQFYKLLFSRTKDIDLVKLAIANEALPLYKRERLKRYV